MIALGFVVTFAMLPLTHGEAILSSTQGLVGHAYHALLAMLVFAYFGWSWTRSGQTLGMRAWRIRLESAGARRLTWAESLVRFLLGTGTRLARDARRLVPRAARHSRQAVRALRPSSRRSS